MKTFFLNLKKSQQISIAILFMTTLIIALGAVYWVLKSHYQPLNHGHLDDAEVRLLAELEQQGIDYKIDSTGNLLVLDEHLGQGQLLAEKDSLNQFASHGLELYDNADYSMTEHTQKVTFQRALQGELERTISALSYVRFARVHLSLAEKKLFSSEQQVSTAAVTLFTSQILRDEQVNAVKALVASSVDGLNVDEVTVLNSNGDVLSSKQALSNTESLYLTREVAVEQKLEDKAAKVLNLFFDPSQYAVSLRSELNLERLTQVSKELIVNDDGKGAIVNQRTTTSSGAEAVKTTAKNKNETSEVQYAHGSRTQELIKKPGEIKRISVAVAIHANVTAQQLSKLKGLLTAALGISLVRGDQFQIESFAPVTPRPGSVKEADTSNRVNITPLVGTVDDSFKKQKATTQHFEFYGQSFSSGLVYVSLCLMLLVMVTLGVMFNKKRLTQAQREHTLIELNQWLAGEKHGA